MSTPEELARRVLAGDRDAEQELLAALRPGLLIVLRHGRMAQNLDAQDIVQETLRIVLERLRADAIDDPQRLFAFAAQTARRLAIGALRTTRRRRTIVDSLLVSRLRIAGASAAEEAEQQDLARRVMELLDELPKPRDRLVLTRFYLDGADRQEICAELGVTERQFDLVLFRARERYRRLLETRMPGFDRGSLGTSGLWAIVIAVALAVKDFPLS